MKVLIKAVVLAAWIVTTAGAAGASEITVSKQGDISSLKQAINLAERGDTITLLEGHYQEHDVVIDKPLTIRGKGRAVIDGEGQGYVLIVRSDSVTIKDLEVHHAGTSFIEDYAGILIEKSHHCTVENVRLVDNFFGIYLSESSGILIKNNYLTASGQRETSSGNGIHLWYTKDTRIIGNRVMGHRDGIYFEFVSDVYLRENLSESNLRYGLHFMFSDRCEYENNIFRDNGAGVAVMYTEEVVMTGNRFERNWGSAAYGLLLKEIFDSRIENNLFDENSIGIYLEASNRNVVRHNNFVKNGWAVKIMANSMDNRFIQNNFMGNTFEVATNSRQNFNEFGKNYWSQYEGYDLNRDGVGDVPHRPVRLFSVLVERHPQALILLRSLLVDILDAAEKFMPVLTPETLVDTKPQMRKIQ